VRLAHRLLQLIEVHLPGPRRWWRGARPDKEVLVIRTFRLSTGLACCLIGGVLALSGCERNPSPGPGPKPISGNGTQPPSATAASGAQGTPR